MSEGSEAARGKRHAAAGGPDRLGALPDELLQEVLSFLPSPDAVRTCVLAHRWRDLWKRVPALRISPATAKRFGCATALNKFVNYLLFFRDRSPLHVAELNSFGSGYSDECRDDFDEYRDDFEECVQYLELWVRYSLSCPVAKLCVASDDIDQRWLLPKGIISSEHLTSLELTRVKTHHDLDFSSCVALKDLKMQSCGIYCNRITSPSLKRLRFKECRIHGDVRTQISVPNLIFFRLVKCSGRAPLLESMPSLVIASVRFEECEDRCKNGYEVGDCGDESCLGCHNSNYGKNTCVLLQGFSSCRNLELKSGTEPFILRKDLMRCPIFSKLKTLLLDEWCITTNLDALICFLQHSPVLEKLTLLFPKIHENLVETGASYDLRKKPLILKDLTVEVQCHEADEQVHNVLDILGSYGLPPENIMIELYPKTWTSGSFSFKQRIDGAIIT